MSTPPGQMPPPPTGPPWGPPPANSPRTSRATKWVLGGLALLVVVVVTVAVTFLVTRSAPGTSDPSTTSAGTTTTTVEPKVASADDRDPAGIILDDPTCGEWEPIYTAFAQAQQNGWHLRDPAVPETQWTLDQRAQYEAVGAALRDTSRRTVELAVRTPHRVMRHLYEQFIAYSRTYADRIPGYTADADAYVGVSVSVAETLKAVCNAISYGSAGARSPLVPRAAPTPGPLTAPSPDNPEMFLTELHPQCERWITAAQEFVDATSAWRQIDPNIPADQLAQAQREVNAATFPVMESYADETQLIGRESDVATWVDIATFSSQYRRAYASALLTYAPADEFLQAASGNAVSAVTEACRAVGADG